MNRYYIILDITEDKVIFINKNYYLFSAYRVSALTTTNPITRLSLGLLPRASLPYLGNSIR